ncbi:EAL domain-containing protein [Sphingomonas oligophenolica]|uniref:EAL domain-containing protein n=2 Tax=Sphingomonas oligophenolica TaxID=301154 RepID=A0A502CIS6_9SPHN|nr:EAL domain-containing protein [Sphingomonas oligophenolica]
MDHVVERLSARHPRARFVGIGRRQIDIAFDGAFASDLEKGTASFTRSCAQPFDLDGRSHRVEMVFGGAAASMQRVDEILLVEQAEQALAKSRAADRAVVHELGAIEKGEAAWLTAGLQRALDHDELFLHYQPKLNVRRQEITSAEALIRWQHPQRGVIMPGDFIPAAEQSRLIGPVTLWTIRRSIADQASLAARGHDLRIFINISGQLLSDASFVRAACELVATTDAKLGFEVTETSVIRDPQSAIANLQAFADYGIVISIDDYGAGLSSLAYLKQLPARELKIDRLFVTQLTRSNRDPLIVRSTIDLAHALEMEVVAEGVETHAAMALLTVMGCDMIQGFLICRPIGLDMLAVFLNEDRHAELKPDDATFFGVATATIRR